jgi:hypothetical protein
MSIAYRACIFDIGGTAKALRDAGVPCEMVFKIHEGRPNPMDLMKNGEISLIMLTSSGDAVDLSDGKELRRLALGLDIPSVTTLAGCHATAAALRAMRSGPLVQTAIQDYFREWLLVDLVACCALTNGDDLSTRPRRCLPGHSVSRRRDNEACGCLARSLRAAGYKDDSLDIILG